MTTVVSDRYPGELLPVGAKWQNNIGKSLAGPDGLGSSPDGLGHAETPVNLDGPYTPGVTNPYTTHVHPYPTRFHGAIYTRPVFGKPYVRSPHAVFKPDDFYEYYGVNGLGSLGGNSMGSAATGGAIYWYASKPNTKITNLQLALNTVLVEYGMLPIAVTGVFESTTYGAFEWAMAKHRNDLRAQTTDEIIAESARMLVSAKRGGARALPPEINPTPPVDLTERTLPPPENLAVKVEDPQETTDPVALMTKKKAPVQMDASKAPEGNSKGMLIFGALLAAGAGFYLIRKEAKR